MLFKSKQENPKLCDFNLRWHQDIILKSESVVKFYFGTVKRF